MALRQWQNPVVVSRSPGPAGNITALDAYGHSMPAWQRDTAEAFARRTEHGKAEYYDQGRGVTMNAGSNPVFRSAFKNHDGSDWSRRFG